MKRPWWPTAGSLTAVYLNYPPRGFSDVNSLAMKVQKTRIKPVMSEPKSFCRRCKTRVDFIVAGGLATCPGCGHVFEMSEIAHPVVKTSDSDLLWTILTAVVIIVGMLLVGLAFAFAECAHQLRNI
jgi:hypothetical protein